MVSPQRGQSSPLAVVHHVAAVGLGGQTLAGQRDQPLDRGAQHADDRRVQPFDLVVGQLWPCACRERASRRAGSRWQNARPIPAIARWSRRKPCSWWGCSSIALRSASDVEGGVERLGAEVGQLASSSSGLHSQAPARRFEPRSVIDQADADLEADRQHRRARRGLCGRRQLAGGHQVHDSVFPSSAVNSSRLARRPTSVKPLADQRADRRVDRLHGREVGDRHGVDRLARQSRSRCAMTNASSSGNSGIRSRWLASASGGRASPPLGCGVPSARHGRRGMPTSDAPRALTGAGHIGAGRVSTCVWKSCPRAFRLRKPEAILRRSAFSLTYRHEAGAAAYPEVG